VAKKKADAEKPAEQPAASAEIKALEEDLRAAQAEESRLLGELASAHQARAAAEQALAEAQEE